MTDEQRTQAQFTCAHTQYLRYTANGRFTSTAFLWEFSTCDAVNTELKRSELFLLNQFQFRSVATTNVLGRTPRLVFGHRTRCFIRFHRAASDMYGMNRNEVSWSIQAFKSIAPMCALCMWLRSYDARSTAIFLLFIFHSSERCWPHILLLFSTLRVSQVLRKNEKIFFFDFSVVDVLTSVLFYSLFHIIFFSIFLVICPSNNDQHVHVILGGDGCYFKSHFILFYQWFFYSIPLLYFLSFSVVISV